MEFSGFSILDCSILLPGPYLGKLLAQHGCRVFKVESSKKPDPARSMGTGASYQDLNSSKTLVDLDLSAYARGSCHSTEFVELVKKSHGLIEAYRPETKARLGLTAAALHAINPKLVIVSIVGYPEGSPRVNSPAHDLNFQALSGALSLSRDLPALPLADLVGAYQGALAMLAEIPRALATGQGRLVTISLLEAMKDAQSKVAAEYRATGELPSYGNTLVTGKYPCYQIYRAKCGTRIAVGAIESKYWNRFVEVIALPELKDRGMTSGPEGLAITNSVGVRLATQTWAHWRPLLEAADCCVDPVLDYREIYGSV